MAASPDSPPATSAYQPARWPLWAAVVVCLGLFIVLAAPRLLQIAGQDEIVHYVGLGQRLYEHGFSRPAELITFSPHLYGFALWLAHLLLGPGVAVARLPGIAAWCLTALLLGWRLAGSSRERGAAAAIPWILALLALSPLALQAAAIVDIDNTILVPAVLLLCLGVERFVQKPSWRTGALVAGFLWLALWCRITTPAFLLPLFLAYAWWRHRALPAAARLALVLAAGVVLFLLTWWGYCRCTGVSFARPFRYLRDAFVFCTVGAERGIGLGKVALTATYLCFWLGPALVLLGAWLVSQRLQRLWRSRQPEPDDLFLAAGVAILGGYCLLGGTIFGFPKYHCPALPLLLLALAGTWGKPTTATKFLATPSAADGQGGRGGRGCRYPTPVASLAGDRQAPRTAQQNRELGGSGTSALCPQGRAGWLAAGGVVLAGALLQVLVLGDPLLLLRFGLREAVFHGENVRHLLWAGLARPYLLAAALAASVLVPLCRRGVLALPSAILCLALGMNAGLVGLQQVGGYQTGYNYGDRGDARRLADFLAARLPEGASAIVPGEIVYLLQRPAVRHVPNELWTDPSSLRQELLRPDVAAAAASLFTNSMAQVTSLIEVAAALPEYRRSDLGGYVVFLRRAPP